MKKLVTYPGGQPIRPDDFILVQEQALLTAFQIIKGLTNSTNPVIVSGLVLTAGATYSLTAGYFWDGTELCYVPAFTYTPEAGYTLYLKLTSTTTDNRRFYNNDFHDVYLEKSYAAVYENTVPTSSFVFQTLSRLVDLLSINPDANTFQLQQVQVASLLLGFSHALGQPGTAMHVLLNDYNEMMLVCYFTATVTSGIIANITLPIAITNELIGYFWNGTSVGYMKIATNGDVHVANAVTGGTVNTIQFQLNLNAVLPS